MILVMVVVLEIIIRFIILLNHQRLHQLSDSVLIVLFVFLMSMVFPFRLVQVLILKDFLELLDVIEDVGGGFVDLLQTCGDSEHEPADVSEQHLSLDNVRALMGHESASRLPK